MRQPFPSPMPPPYTQPPSVAWKILRCSMEELHKGEKRVKEGDTQRQTSKPKFLLLII